MVYNKQQTRYTHIKNINGIHKRSKEVTPRNLELKNHTDLVKGASIVNSIGLPIIHRN